MDERTRKQEKVDKRTAKRNAKIRKENAAKCEVRKIKRKRQETQQKKVDKVAIKQSRLEKKIKEVKAAIARSKGIIKKDRQEIAESKGTIASSDKDLSNARTAAKFAFEAEMTKYSIHKASQGKSKLLMDDASPKKASKKSPSPEANYEQKRAELQAMHSKVHKAVGSLHEAQSSMNSEHLMLDKLEAQHAVLLAQSHANLVILDTMEKENEMMQDELDNVKKTKLTKEKLKFETPKDTRPVFDRLLSTLRVEKDAHRAFDTTEDVEKEAMKNLVLKPTGKAAKPAAKFAEEEKRLIRIGGEVKKLEKKDPKIEKAEKALAEAKAKGDAAAIEAAKEALQFLLDTQGRGKQSVNELRKQLKAAQNSGNTAEIAVLRRLLKQAEEALDPKSLAGKAYALRKAYKKLKSDCFFNPRSKKTQALWKAWKDAEKAAAIEERGKEASARLNTSGGSGAATKKGGKKTKGKKTKEGKKDTKESGKKQEKPSKKENIKIVETQTKLQAAQGKGDKKLVKKLEKKVKELKDRSKDAFPKKPKNSE